MFPQNRMLSHVGLAAALSLFASTDCFGQADGLSVFEPSLKSIPVPEPTTINDYVASRDAAIRLGKALFWDVRLGSDGMTACATCHHVAGADPRVTNTIHPGPNGAFTGAVTPGSKSPSTIFPLTKFSNPADRFSKRMRSIDDVVGSQGVMRENFAGLNANLTEACVEQPEPVFTANGQSFSQVTGRNAPSVINAIFNVRQFWDGRANAWFNGVNPFGPVDNTAKAWRIHPQTLQPIQLAITIDHGSLASQAVGPVNNDVEMAAHGRGWVDVARKLLPTYALANQRVSPSDSVLGAFAAPGGGLTLRYDQMIEAAFHAQWRARVEVTPGTTMLEANMPLFFGLAVQMYEATLVSNDSRYDQWIERNGPLGLAPGLLTEQELRGLRLFFNIDPSLPETNCRACHISALFSVATYAGKVGGGGGQNGSGAFPPGAVDTDHDSYPDIIDDFPLDPMEWLDTDRDHIGNNADTDDDGDGLPDAIDPFPLDPLNIPDAAPPNPNAEFAPQPIAHMSDMRGTLRKSMVFEEPPMGIEPSIRPMDFTLTGDGVRIYDPSGKLAVHIPLLPRSSFPCNFVFAPTVAVPSLGSSAGVFVDARTRNCRMSLSISILNFPLGTYRVTIDGVDRGFLYSEPINIYDEGFYNIGLRPTTEDLGLGGTHPNGVPLAASRRLYLHDRLPEFGLLWNGGNLEPRVDGSFKTPSLRNVELTPPYFHNGGALTLEDVIRFYNRGGDFHETNQLDIAPSMLAMELEEDHITDLAAFLRTLTDERVRHERAPFDHPSLPLPDGSEVPPIGAAGRIGNCEMPIRTFADNLALTDPLAGDCNRNGLIDSCELNRYPEIVDVNGNGIIDACESAPCPADITNDRTVSGDDLALVLGSWNLSGAKAGAADIDGSGVVDAGDLALILGAWGACP
jgi:cytochrome c peroxidase